MHNIDERAVTYAGTSYPQDDETDLLVRNRTTSGYHKLRPRYRK